jgi:hypothetical protein
MFRASRVNNVFLDSLIFDSRIYHANWTWDPVGLRDGRRSKQEIRKEEILATGLGGYPTDENSEIGAQDAPALFACGDNCLDAAGHGRVGVRRGGCRRSGGGRWRS